MLGKRDDQGVRRAVTGSQTENRIEYIRIVLREGNDLSWETNLTAETCEMIKGEGGRVKKRG